ncbi:MAG: carbon-nitrogen hydrolase [Planctomycetes bacterium]|nr:carbon-nitrogen hydrolase [Planctomycetota bacterium]
MPRKIPIALLQHAAPPSEPRDSVLKRVERMAREAKERGARIICTQELFAGPYFCQVEDASRMDLAEPIPGPTTGFLGRLAKELQVEIVGSLYERRAPGLYHNTAVLLDPTGNILGKYRKMHIPEDPRFFEKFYFTPGDLGWQAVRGRDASIGMLVCWDQWYPEAARLTALKGAEIIFYPTAIGWWHGETPGDAKQQKEAWKLMHRSHAIANGVFVAAVNRVGTEDDLKFWGGSLLIDPGGEVLCEGSEDKEEVLIGECDLGRIEELRRGWPFLRDRRVDAYAGLTQRFLDGGDS